MPVSQASSVRAGPRINLRTDNSSAIYNFRDTGCSERQSGEMLAGWRRSVRRIGRKVERERLGANGEVPPTLEIAVPYLAATYDERMFEELYRRAQLFEVTLGGDMRVEGRIEQEQVKGEKRIREKAGIGTEDEELGTESENTGAVDLPKNMVERLRVDLSVWKHPQREAQINSP